VKGSSAEVDAVPTCEPIGTARTPLETSDDAPRQGFLADVEGTIELDPAYGAGLSGVEPGDDVLVVWFADRADRSVLALDRDGRGVFATRSPARPNPICLTECAVLAVDGPSLSVRGVDMLDGSPVLDLKRSLDPER
jgi:tRNA-Thr(GGU) m(6)t(6)A37 methyltransferase TsaA